MEYLIAAVEEKTLTSAAQKLHITQPALSRSIMRMEKSVGVPLFNRVGKNMTVNKYGKLLYQWAKRSVDEYQHTLVRMNELLKDDNNIVTIGCCGYVYPMPIIMGFQMAYPHILLNNFKFSRHEFPNIIYQNSVDCILSVMDFSADDTKSLLLYHGPLFAALPKSHRLSQRKNIYLEEIKDEPLIMSAGDTLYQEKIEEMFRQAHAVPRIVNKVEPSHLISMIQEGIGCSIINAETVHLFPEKAKKCACIPLADHFCFINVYLIWRKRFRYSDSFRLFHDYLKEQFHICE